MLTWEGHDGPDILVDDGGDATLMIREGVKAELEFEKLQTLPDPDKHENGEMKEIMKILRRLLEKGETHKWRKMAENLKGVSEETTTGVLRLEQMAQKGELLIKAINVNDSVTK